MSNSEIQVLQVYVTYRLDVDGKELGPAFTDEEGAEEYVATKESEDGASYGYEACDLDPQSDFY